MAKYTLNDIRRALRKVRTKLLNGKISEDEFDMARVLSKGHCGTVACIGGHMAMELNPKIGGVGAAQAIMNDARFLQPNLWDLFYDYPMENGRWPTRIHAAAAITRALDGAQSPWRSRHRRVAR